MKRALSTMAAVLTLFSYVTPALAQTDYPSLPGSNVQDFSRPGYRIESTPTWGNTNVYPTVPGTNFRDFTRPGITIDRQGNGY
jgi:hypothetical protein